MSFVTRASSFLGRRPWAAQLYVTDQCNLDCHYCNEYDNSVPHPSLSDLQAWLQKIRDLGVTRLQLQGGEPLMHPDFVEVVRYAKRVGFVRVGTSTNGFLLTPEFVQSLDEAGLDSCQISVDRMTPIASTRKSLKTVLHKLKYFEGSRISGTVTGVLFDDTVEEMAGVIDACLDRDVGVSARLVHDDLINRRELRGKETGTLLEFLDYQARLKESGERIHQPWRILDYQRSLLRGEPEPWKCLAGYRFFMVSSRGKFWLCSQVRTERDIMDVTLEDLRAYNTHKDCETGCGVYCVISTSFMFNRPVRGLLDEAREWAWSRRAAVDRSRRGGAPSAARKHGWGAEPDRSSSAKRSDQLRVKNERF